MTLVPTPVVAPQSGGSPTPTATPHGARISVCIVCCNEGDRLGPCLQSVAWADEIIVMDLASNDGSPALAASLGARVILHAPAPIVEPLRNELAALAMGDWVLALDPDERLAPGLPAALRAAALRSDIDAVVIPRMNFDLGYAPSNPLHRYEPQLRMYRRNRVSWPTFIHRLPEVPESRSYSLPQRDDLVIIHDRHRTVVEIVERITRYAPAQAQAMFDAGQRFSARAMFAELGFVAYKQFVRGNAWADGVPGMLRASIMLAQRFFVWAAFWQLSGGQRTAEDDRILQGIGGIINLVLRGGRMVAKGISLVLRLGQRQKKS